MDETKAIRDWEPIKGVVLVGVADEDLDMEITEEKFDQIKPELKIGCDWDARLSFLNSNGYEVTRDNIVNPNLHARQTNLWPE